MLDLTLWEDRLKTAQTDLKKIGSAADLPAARDNLKQDPALYFVLGSERAGANPYSNAVHQQISVEVLVFIAVRHAGAATGKQHIDQLNSLRGQIDAALLGWQPDDTADPVEYVSGRLMGFKDNIMWWGDIYRTTYDKRSV